MNRPAQTGGSVAPSLPHPITGTRDASPETEKEPTNSENPIVFFDITIGGQSSICLRSVTFTCFALRASHRHEIATFRNPRRLLPGID